MSCNWLVSLRDGRTCEIAADEMICNTNGAAQFIENSPGEGRVSVVSAFARGHWVEVRRTDATLTWHATPPVQPPRFA